MQLFTFFSPVLDALNRGTVIRKGVAIALRVLGILIALAGLAGIIKLLKMAFQPRIPPAETGGGFILAVLLCAALLCVVQICFYRARNVSALPVSEYTVVPIVSMVLRAVGEILATLGVTVGVGGFLIILLSPPGLGVGLLQESGLPGIFIHQPSSQSSFIAAVGVLVYAVVMSFAAILFFYFFAELWLAFIDVARRMEIQGRGAAPLSASRDNCTRCGAPLEPDSEFCDQCGTGRPIAPAFAQA